MGIAILRINTDLNTNVAVASYRKHASLLSGGVNRLYLICSMSVHCIIQKILITNKCTKRFFNCKTLLHVSTLLGHLQGELSVTVTLGLQFYSWARMCCWLCTALVLEASTVCGPGLQCSALYMYSANARWKQCKTSVLCFPVIFQLCWSKAAWMHSILTHVSVICFNIIVKFEPKSPKWSFPLLICTSPTSPC
jgi:hypothetical protein